jgi:hypothetical protein
MQQLLLPAPAVHVVVPGDGRLLLSLISAAAECCIVMISLQTSTITRSQ